MTDRPIIFSAPMVRALLDGRKTQTRRVLKPQPGGIEQRPLGFVGSPARFVFTEVHPGGANWTHYAKIPYTPGDRLWVREAFVTGFDIDDEYGRPVGDKKVWYRATDSNLTWYDPDTESTIDNPPWKSSILMPRWASRLTLTVTDVRVQRLQEISEADAMAEGCDAVLALTIKRPNGAHPGNPRECYCDLWNSLHGPGAWDANPWVVAITFDVVARNIDAT